MKQKRSSIWWEDLSTDVKDSINKSAFNKKILDVDTAYVKFGKVIY